MVTHLLEQSFLNIVDDVCLMGEAVFSDYYDGYGNGEWDDSADNEEDK